MAETIVILLLLSKKKGTSTSFWHVYEKGKKGLVCRETEHGGGKGRGWRPSGRVLSGSPAAGRELSPRSRPDGGRPSCARRAGASGCGRGQLSRGLHSPPRPGSQAPPTPPKGHTEHTSTWASAAWSPRPPCMATPGLREGDRFSLTGEAEVF